MSSYKVPQDVEAEDKLLGPFSFRQFIYLIVTAIGIALCWGLGRLFLPLAVFPLPIVILFGLLALPLRKDQPMETYLLAILSFYIKPRKRLWQPDGIQSLVEITAPKTVEVQRVKDISRNEAARRLSYLADVVDSQGWSVRGISNPEETNSMVSDVYYEAQQTDDILDDNNAVSRSFDQRIEQTSARQRQEVMDRMKNPQPHVFYDDPLPPPSTSQPQQFNTNPYDNYLAQEPQEADPQLTYNPYPTIQQSVVSPHGDRVADYHKSKQAESVSQQASSPSTAPAQTSPTPPAQSSPAPENKPSEKPVSPDIINLANNSDLSIQTIANEAGRISKKEKELKDDEVVISLR